MTTHPEICRAFDSAIRRLFKHGVTLKSGKMFMLTVEGKTVSRFDSVDGLTAFADALDYAEARDGKAVVTPPVETVPPAIPGDPTDLYLAGKICRRLDKHNVDLRMDGRFIFEADGVVIHETDSNDAVTSFVAALDFAAGKAAAATKTHPVICWEFDQALHALDDRPFEIKSDDEKFFVVSGAGNVVYATETVDGLTAFVAEIGSMKREPDAVAELAGTNPTGAAGDAVGQGSVVDALLATDAGGSAQHRVTSSSASASQCRSGRSPTTCRLPIR